MVIGKMLTTGYLLHPLVTSFGSLLMYAIPFVLVIKVGLKGINKDLLSGMKEEFSRIDYRIVGTVFILTPFVGVLLEPLINLLPAPPEFLNKIFRDLFKPNFLSFLAIAVAPAILEEILCRGIILEGLLKRYSPTKAIIWSAVLFGAMHLNPWQGLTGLVLGLFIGWVYHRTKSIYPGILIHFVNNALSYFAWLAWGDKVTSLQGIMTPFSYYLLVAASLLVGVAGMWFLNKQMPKKSEATVHPLPEVKPVLS
ncbi:hypothetical protein GCM10011405_37980 [Rufibacter glacialis]|nr:hypothetical protein GCM10011405_37980 [Rufibacter glacialis]